MHINQEGGNVMFFSSVTSWLILLPTTRLSTPPFLPTRKPKIEEKRQVLQDFVDKEIKRHSFHKIALI